MQNLIKNILVLAKSLIANEIPSHIEHWQDEFETDDYPYGRLRTKASWKVEGSKGKQRVSRITIDPKTGRTNAAKVTTYGTAAKLGIANNRCFIVVGNPSQISVYDGTMTFLGALFPKDSHFKTYSDGLGFKEVSDEIRVHKDNHSATISGLHKFTIRDLLNHCGINNEEIKLVDTVVRKGQEWTVKFKEEANRQDFIIKQITN